MKKKFTTALAIGLGLLFVVNISHAAILDIRNGQLFGAAGVDVDGVLYDVAFRDGTPIELYEGADENTDFPFTNLLNLSDSSLAVIANQALLDQVFIDSPLGAFDSAPNLTNGCASLGSCYVYTPMVVNSAGGMGVVGVCNKKAGYKDVIFAAGSIFRTSDTSPLEYSPETDDIVWAVWNKTSAVPIPGTVWLLGSCLAGLIGLRRKKK
ncbi:MAG: hypothetical protein KQH63_09090 [Desulfobulbaceae bacterium]|nr:hypothetical protein [Desulfobulbaceae bacterium]